MEYKNKNDLIQKGPLYKVILTLSIPLVISNLVQTLSDLGNTYWLSFLGKEEIAASSFVWPVLFLFISIGFGIYVAGAAILSQLLGRDELNEANHYANHLIFLTFLIAIGLTVIGYVSTEGIVSLMQADADFREPAIVFLRISFLSFPFMAVYFAFQAVLNAQGKTLELMIANGLSLIVNIVLAPLFIFKSIPGTMISGMGLGIQGAAWASVASKAFLLLLGFILLKRASTEVQFHFKDFKVDKLALGKILKIAIPAMMGQGGAAFGFIILHSVIGSYGTDTIFAFSLINRITGVVSMPAMGIGAGITAVIGQNIGAGNMSRVYETFKKANIINIIATGIGALLIALFTKEVIGFFVDESTGNNAIALCNVYLNYSIPIIPLMGMFSILQGLFQGSGYTRYSMYMEIGRLWVLRLPMIVLFGWLTSLGSTGIWISMTSSNLFIILYGFWLYSKRKWVQGNFISS